MRASRLNISYYTNSEEIQIGIDSIENDYDNFSVGGHLTATAERVLKALGKKLSKALDAEMLENCPQEIQS